ncbi:MAG: AAA family ATPase [Gammaproteobacteria bacterium]|nr:AAA family ATPase [Gammaproteobacteria bacterium]MBU1724193.1 AAA family ATPase [Gammaproteobacteria bacterium]MBU2005062.1 AAA family ATPase [Gammaproteobacteria bacterium]
MFITHIKLKNWKNFREADIPLYPQTYLIGPNASGKSNLLDVFRFLRDVAKSSGGGLQKAVEDRGGIGKLRCLHARKDTEVKIEVGLALTSDAEPVWQYVLGFKSEGVGRQRTQITQETIIKNGKILLNRPDKEDKTDRERLTQTHLEQISSNKEFRDVVEFFAVTTYLHIVPQLLKYGDKIGGNTLEEDPLGQKFLERIADTSDRTRKARLDKIEEALKVAVPRFEAIRFVRDEKNGHPHLEARYGHHRPNAGWQREDQFSDGTLRLLGLLWMLLDGDSLLLMEEPELSLNNSIVERIPELIQRIQRKAKHKRQVLISTHSEALLSNPGIDSRAVLILEPGTEGTHIRSPNSEELATVDTGFSIAEVLLPKVKPQGIEQLGLF